MTYDKIIIGAGLYGLYAAQKCGGQRRCIEPVCCGTSRRYKTAVCP